MDIRNGPPSLSGACGEVHGCCLLEVGPVREVGELAPDPRRRVRVALADLPPVVGHLADDLGGGA
eukprot:596776-Alexandrium_andersonii.AAC.1